MNPEDIPNYAGEERKVGFEIEYIGLSIEQTADTIVEAFKGKKHWVNDLIIEVKTSLGQFKIEKDAELLQKLAEKSKENIENNKLDLEGESKELLITLLNDFVPNEVVCPPIPIKEIKSLDAMVEKLRKSGAKGTSESLAYAFGLHINPEVSSFESMLILNHLQAFALLYDLIAKKMQIDFTRKISFFVQPYPQKYNKLILNPDYQPKFKDLVFDYIENIPSRNFALDLYPLFMHIDEDLIKNKVKVRLIKPRPTFHFRMPNCQIGNPNWNISHEWQYWSIIETLAHNHELRQEMMTKFKAMNDKLLPMMTSDWVTYVESQMNGLYES